MYPSLVEVEALSGSGKHVSHQRKRRAVQTSVFSKFSARYLLQRVPLQAAGANKEGTLVKKNTKFTKPLPLMLIHTPLR